MSDRFSDRRAFEVASFKAIDDAKGEFEAIVSVFGNVDYGGDRVVKGAFAKSLAKWEESGDPIPVIWNHMWENPEAHIGAIKSGDAVETEDGLLVRGRLDLDNPFAKQVYRLLSERRVKEFSFGYNVRDSERKDGALELLEVDLFEVGPTLKGMNPATELLAVKALACVTADDTIDDHVTVGYDGELVEVDDSGAPLDDPAPVDFKAGARLSKETRAALERARDEINSLLSVDDASSEEQPKSITEAEAAGKASDVDADIRTQLQLVKEM